LRSSSCQLKSNIFSLIVFRRLRKAERNFANMSAYKIVMIRHGESEWNQENRFCGWFDAHLSEKGVSEAKQGGQVIHTFERLLSPYKNYTNE